MNCDKKYTATQVESAITGSGEFNLCTSPIRTVVAHTPTAALGSHKPFATAQARAALAGFTLRQIEGDDGQPLFIVTRCALTRAFRDLAEFDVWLACVTAGGQPS